MSDRRKKHPSPGEVLAKGIAPCVPNTRKHDEGRGGSRTAPTFVMRADPAEKLYRAIAHKQIKDIVAVLADIERLATPLAEDVRTRTERFADAQDDLVRAMGAVRDLAIATTSVGQAIRTGSLGTARDVQSAVHAVTLLAAILRRLNALCKTTAATLQARTSATQELVDIVGEAAKASINLVGKVSTLAEEIQTALPPLSNKNLVQAELNCLAGELEKVITKFQEARDASPPVAQQYMASAQTIH